jgi:hypothetical protein
LISVARLTLRARLVVVLDVELLSDWDEHTVRDWIRDDVRRDPRLGVRLEFDDVGKSITGVRLVRKAWSWSIASKAPWLELNGWETVDESSSILLSNEFIWVYINGLLEFIFDCVRNISFVVSSGDKGRSSENDDDERAIAGGLVAADAINWSNDSDRNYKKQKIFCNYEIFHLFHLQIH